MTAERNEESPRSHLEDRDGGPRSAETPATPTDHAPFAFPEGYDQQALTGDYTPEELLTVAGPETLLRDPASVRLPGGQAHDGGASGAQSPSGTSADGRQADTASFSFQADDDFIFEAADDKDALSAPFAVDEPADAASGSEPAQEDFIFSPAGEDPDELPAAAPPDAAPRLSPAQGGSGAGPAAETALPHPLPEDAAAFPDGAEHPDAQAGGPLPEQPLPAEVPEEQRPKASIAAQDTWAPFEPVESPSFFADWETGSQSQAAAPDAGEKTACPAPGEPEAAERESAPEDLSEAGLIDPLTDPPGIPRPPDEPEMVALRTLLLSRELALLERLKRRLEDPVAHARDVSDVVAEAILLRTAKDDDKLDRALDPVVEKIFKSSLRKKPLDFANAIFPLMGPAIRRSITETFRSMLEGFHKSVEMAFSWKGLRWRFESLRTGRPFSEVVMLNTLVYRVEQLFLIHRETGLVLNHLVDEGVASQDADMVSAMLTAIQDFVRDCFVSGQEGDLESLQLGDYTIIVEQSPYAYLACVVRGTPPMDFRKKLRTTLELIQVEFLDHLANFNGDTTPFTFAARLLEDCLVSRFQDEKKPLPWWAKAMPAVVILGIAGALIFWRYSVNAAEEEALRASEESRQKQEEFLYGMDAYVDALRAEPGIVVVDVKDYTEPPWVLICMKDELARDPYEVLRQAGAPLENFQVSLIPYISLDPGIVTARVKQTIHPPDTVHMEFDADGTLRLSGTAPMDWIMEARQEALSLPGVKKLNFEKLSDPRMERLKAMVRQVESVSIEFPLGKDTPVPEDMPKLRDIVDTLAELEKLAAEMGISVQLTIFGHADTIGNDQRNYDISQARARMLAAMLYGKGSSLPVTLYGMGAEYANRAATSPLGDPASRRIELRVHLTRMASATPEDLRK